MTKDEAFKKFWNTEIVSAVTGKVDVPMWGDIDRNDTAYIFMAGYKACKEALEQPAQEPVDYEGSGLAAKIMDCDVLGNPIITMLKQCPIGTKLYLKPVPLWQGLSDDDINNIYGKSTYEGLNGFARAIEQALKEKNT